MYRGYAMYGFGRFGHAPATLLALGLALGGCSDDGGGGSKDGGGGNADAKVSQGGADGGTTGRDSTVGGDVGSTDGASTTADAAPSFTRELTLGLDDGLPVIKLVADPLSKGHTLLQPPAKLLPLKVLEVRFLPVNSYSVTVSIDKLGTQGRPGTPIQSRTISATAASSLDDWAVVDLRDKNIVVDSDFWVTLSFPASMAGGEVLYGSSSASGNNYYSKPPTIPLHSVNFDQIIRVVVATGNEDMATLGDDGASCEAAVDCKSGLCLAGNCSSTCIDACTGGRECRAFELDLKACITPCTQDDQCPDRAFCLTDVALIDPAGFCVDGGPLAANASCTGHYHTICQSGKCSACQEGSATCSDVGTCE